MYSVKVNLIHLRLCNEKIQEKSPFSFSQFARAIRSVAIVQEVVRDSDLSEEGTKQNRISLFSCIFPTDEIYHTGTYYVQYCSRRRHAFFSLYSHRPTGRQSGNTELAEPVLERNRPFYKIEKSDNGLKQNEKKKKTVELADISKRIGPNDSRASLQFDLAGPRSEVRRRHRVWVLMEVFFFVSKNGNDIFKSDTRVGVRLYVELNSFGLHTYTYD